MTDLEFAAAFESCVLPEADWHHREHIRIAYIYLCALPFGEALEALRDSLKAYNASHGVPETLDRGYHETITCAWMHLVYCTFSEYGPEETSEAFVDKHSQLLNSRALLLFYSRDRLKSMEAKQTFLEPDLTALPRSVRK